MQFEQYIDCVIQWNGRLATISGAVDCYEGSWITFTYENGDTGRADCFDDDFVRALPDPEYGLLKRRYGKVLFFYNDMEYKLGDNPLEPCIYIIKDDKIICTLHYAFTIYDLPEWFASGKKLLGINGIEYDGTAFCRVLAASIDSGCADLDFPAAAELVKEYANRLNYSELRNGTNSANGVIERRGKDVLFVYNGVEYELGDHPFEPCTYIKKDGKIICTLHNAFTVYDLPEWFADGKSLQGIDGKEYDETAFCKVLAASIDSGRTDMDFPFAAGLVNAN